MENSDVDPWGCCVDFQTNHENWIVNNVHEGKQADRKGIKTGWKILKVEHRGCSFRLDDFNQEEIKQILTCGDECTIHFRPVSVIFFFSFFTVLSHGTYHMKYYCFFCFYKN